MKQKIKINRLKEEIIKISHESGLEILLKPMEKFSSAVAVFSFKFGSVDCVFQKEGESSVTVPSGVAHYLEHKLFENADNSVTFELFSKERALANAETSFNYTSYYFSSPAQNFLKALKILLNFVQTPYFTDENVEKEKGIITQEIKMNEDDPEWAAFFTCLSGMYYNSYVNLKIAGTVESIQTIDKEILYECYNTFYGLNNAGLILVGNFKIDEVMNLVNSELKKTKNFNFKRIVKDEPKNVKNKYSNLYMSVKTPIFTIGFKLQPVTNKELLQLRIGFKILFELLFGEGSHLYNEFYEKELVVGSDVSCELLSGENYLAVLVAGESKKPKIVLDKICEEIKRKKEEGFDLNEFELVKKMIYKEYVEQLSQPEKMAGYLTEMFIEGSNEYDKLELVVGCDINEVVKCLNLLDEENKNLTVVLPVKDSRNDRQ